MQVHFPIYEWENGLAKDEFWHIGGYGPLPPRSASEQDMPDISMHLLARSYGRLSQVAKNVVVNLLYKVAVYTVQFTHIFSVFCVSLENSSFPALQTAVVKHFKLLKS